MDKSYITAEPVSAYGGGSLRPAPAPPADDDDALGPAPARPPPSSAGGAAEEDTAQAWLHGSLSRGEAEDMLRAHGATDGLFLVRTKDRRLDIYTVSLCLHGEFEHHILDKKVETGLFALNDTPLSKACPTLTASIRHLRRNREAMATHLIKGVSA
jgi:hypothetical protein